MFDSVPDVFEPQGLSESHIRCQFVELASHQVVGLAYSCRNSCRKITLSPSESVVLIEILLAWFLNFFRASYSSKTCEVRIGNDLETKEVINYRKLHLVDLLSLNLGSRRRSFWVRKFQMVQYRGGEGNKAVCTRRRSGL